MRQLLDVRSRRRTRLAGIRACGCWPLANRLRRDFLRFRFVAVHRCSPTCAVAFGPLKDIRRIWRSSGTPVASGRAVPSCSEAEAASAMLGSAARLACYLLITVIRIWVAVAAIAVPTGVATVV